MTAPTRYYRIGGPDVPVYPESNPVAREEGRPVVVIDPEDTEAVERLGALMRASGCRWSTDVQTALREFANPKPKREWRTGDVVQSKSNHFTAQRHSDGWFTTTSANGKPWNDDETVTEWVEHGHLIVLREQAAGVQP